MADDNAAFQDLTRRIREGSEDAAWELVERYGEEIRRAVRRLLNDKLRSKFDSLDFVQLVWSSFFRARDQLDRFECPAALAKFLIVMTRNKVGMETRRRLRTEKYNVHRETPLDEPEPRTSSDSKQPTPSHIAIAHEQYLRMLSGQPSHYRRIVQLRLEGFTHQEIADQLGLAESTVRRFLTRLFHEAVT